MVTQKRISDRIPRHASEKGTRDCAAPSDLYFIAIHAPTACAVGYGLSSLTGLGANVHARNKHVQLCSVVSICARCKRSE